jgi:radical SAM protein with 4Fe4S-binding SPASM domain
VYCLRDYVTHTDLQLDVYKRCIDAFPEAEEVWPHGIGEPLLYPWIVEAVQYAADAGMKVILYTNASLLTEEIGLALVDAGLTRMVFSVDAADPQTYALLRPGLSWNAVVYNAERFCKLSDMHTTARITVTIANKDLKREITEFWINAGVNNVKLVPVNDIPTLDFSPLHSSVQNSVDCVHPYEHFILRVNGDVVPCCRDRWSHYKMGNVNGQHPRAIWEGDTWRKLRVSMASGHNYPRLCDICKAVC